MKKLTMIIGLMLVIVVNTYPQVKLITSIKDGNITYYTSLANACGFSPAGSHIILPGGIWGGGFPITKELHIYGVGHYPEFTSATEKTVIQGRLEFRDGSNNSSLTGLEIRTTYEQSALSFTSYFNQNNYIDNITISKCILIGGGKYGLEVSGVTNLKVYHCIINGVEAYVYKQPPAGQAIFENNIIIGSVREFYYAIFDHNIFIKYNNEDLVITFYSRYTNNIIIGDFSDYRSFIYYDDKSQCQFLNNIFTCPEFTILPQWQVLFEGNIFNVSTNDLFIDYSTPGFDYGNDYHLKSSSIGKNASTDGTDIGIYGGSNPYKEGAVPVIPHITNLQLGNELIDGKLQINVSVEAQTK